MFDFFRRIPSISAAELQQKIQKKLNLIDVRTPAEYRSGHISIAKNVPLNKIAQYEPKQAGELFVICQSGMRSKKAARILAQKGYKVVNVKGGMNQWRGSMIGGK